MNKIFFIVIFLTIASYAYKKQSNILIDLYSDLKPFLHKLEKVEDLKALKTLLNGGYTYKKSVEKDLKKLLKINEKEKIFTEDELKNLFDIIQRLQLYQKTPIG
ncbi:hypothetical protein [Nitrosophilus labii]|uniref:hypothetical protein n=1 Tax=Nitrosophilus labii TaxID=2706014 RepID=UPI0016572474|nr:hypothetical protein [Nitrosophilus labii]